jgi:hypothetical protein
MKPHILGLVAGLLAFALVDGARFQARVDPVTKVADLMQNLQDKVEEEGRSEETVFQNFSCYATGTIRNKNTAIANAQSRITMLQGRIQELNSSAGLPDESSKLKASLAQVTTDINATQAARLNESLLNVAAVNSTKAAVAGLEAAKQTLAQVLKLAQTGATRSTGLLSLRGSSQSFTELEQKAAELSRGLEIAEQYLSPSDALFLRRVLTADVSEVQSITSEAISDNAVHFLSTNDKSSQTPANSSASYQPRSANIMDQLNKLSVDLKNSVNATLAKEENSKKSFSNLLQQKDAEKTSIEQALTAQVKEKEARLLAINQAQTEVTALTNQVTADKQTITDLQQALDVKTKEYETRSKLRQDELTALAQALQVLRSDDARDLFTKRSKAMSFLQTDSVVRSNLRREASDALLAAASQVHDSRLMTLAIGFSSNISGSFDQVFTKIDTMIKVLNDEEVSDVAKKTKCETDKVKDLKDRSDTKSSIQDLSTSVDLLAQRLRDMQTQISENNKQLQQIADEMANAKRVREAEAAEHEQAKKDDAQAMDLIQNAKTIISNVFKGVGSFVQTDSEALQPVVNSAAGNKILAMMDQLTSDLKKDVDSASTAEKNAVALFQKAQQGLQDQVKNLNNQNDALKSTAGDKTLEKGDKETEADTKKKELKVIEKRMKDVEPECNFFVEKYATRSQDRELEKQGLLKAKSILQNYSAF